MTALDASDAHLVKCLVISELFLPTKGGTAVWFAEVYRRLGGRSIHIVTADVAGAAEFDRQHPNTVHRVAMRRYAWLKPESLALYLRLFWRSLMVCYRYDAVSVHAGRVLPEGLVAWIVAKILRRPLIIYAHGEEITTWRTTWKRRAMIFAYRHAERVVANSKFTRSLLIDMGVTASRIALINPGVDIAAFHPGEGGGEMRRRLGLRPDQRLILSVGRLSRRKGFDQVVRSLPDLVARGLDVHYAIVGIGEDEHYLRFLADDIDCSSRVHLLAHQTSEDLPRWYRAADVFAMPNREVDGDTEGFGMVFLEAAASGLAAVAGVAGGAGDAVLDGQTGLCVNGADLNEVRDALWRLLSDPPYAKQLGEAGLKRVRQNHTWEAVAGMTMSVMRDLA